MSMLAIQRSTLNAFGDNQTALKTFGQLDGKLVDDIRIGDLIAGNGLDDVYANRIYTVSTNVPAPAAGVVTKWVPMIKAPFNGFITKAEMYVYDDTATWTAGTTTAQNYTVSLVTTYTAGAGITNNNAANFLTGVTNNTVVELPLTRLNPSVTNLGQNYTIAATGLVMTITAAVGFANPPAVGDILNIPPTATNAPGTNKVNVGVYKVTSVTATVIVATKLNATNPVAVATFAAAATEILLSRQQAFYSVATLDQVGVAIVVPASGGTPVNISKINLAFNLTLKLNPV